jgi:hypothetical protein
MTLRTDHPDGHSTRCGFGVSWRGGINRLNIATEILIRNRPGSDFVFSRYFGFFHNTGLSVDHVSMIRLTRIVLSSAVAERGNMALENAGTAGME